MSAPETTTTTTPRIYVASLSDYNAGTLHGVWIDLTDDLDDVWNAIRAMLADSPEARSFPAGGPAEEWAIHDHEGFPDGTVGEHSDIDELHALAADIDEHGDPFLAWLTVCDSAEADGSTFLDKYRGEFDSVADYVAEFVEDCYGDTLAKLPDFLRYRIDWEGVARDFELGGDICTADAGGGSVYVFEPNA